MGAGFDVTVARDVCVVLPLSRHLAMPPAGEAKPDLHLDLPCNVAWPPGGAVGAHSLTHNVFHRGSTIALSGHDFGVMILHWCLKKKPWPPNPALALIIPFSERKVCFSSSIVKMNGKEAALAALLAMPMTLCADPCPFPVMFPEHSGCTVRIGCASTDLLAGWANIGIDMVAGSLDKGGGPTAKVADQATEKFLGLPSAKGMVVGLAKGAVGYSLKGKGKVEVGVGSPYANKKWTLEWEREKGKVGPTKVSVSSSYRLQDKAIETKAEFDSKGVKIVRSYSDDDMGGLDGGGGSKREVEDDLGTGKTKTTEEHVDRGERQHSKTTSPAEDYDWDFS